MSRDPSSSFPRALGDRAGLEALYRFVNNEAVSYEPLIEAYADTTALRARQHAKVIAVHDTSEIVLDPRVEGIGRLRGRDKGFLAHVALVVTADGERRPLGLAAFIPVVRTGKPRGRRITSTELAKLPADEKESRRWADAVEMAEGHLAEQAVVHVADREADSYPLLSHMVDRGFSFVFRICRDRRVEEVTGDPALLRDSMERSRIVIRRQVPIAGRPTRFHKGGLLRTAARTERVARLAISARELELKKPTRGSGGASKSVPVKIVWVRELDAPDGEPPIDWMLATSEPISTPDEIEAIIDAYRTRWLIEEFFKALKTGCAFEKRQLESLDAFLITFALLAPVACHLLELRNLARANPQRPAGEVLGPVMLQILRIQVPRARLPAKPTLRDALLAIAALGGHLKNNGEPGWLVLGRGMEDLVKAESIWRAATKAATEM